GNSGYEVTSEVVHTNRERGSRVGRQTITDDDHGRFRRLLAAQPANRPSQGLRIDALPIQRGLEQTAEVGAHPPPRGLSGLEDEVMDLVEPSSPVGRGRSLPGGADPSPVPCVRSETED